VANRAEPNSGYFFFTAQRARLLGVDALRLDFQYRKGRLDRKTPNDFAHERHAGSALRRPNGIDVLIRDMLVKNERHDDRNLTLRSQFIRL
jgi:hypothetical protein